MIQDTLENIIDQVTIDTGKVPALILTSKEILNTLKQELETYLNCSGDLKPLDERYDAVYTGIPIKVFHKEPLISALTEEQAQEFFNNTSKVLLNFIQGYSTFTSINGEPQFILVNMTTYLELKAREDELYTMLKTPLNLVTVTNLLNYEMMLVKEGCKSMLVGLDR